MLSETNPWAAPAAADVVRADEVEFGMLPMVRWALHPDSVDSPENVSIRACARRLAPAGVPADGPSREWLIRTLARALSASAARLARSDPAAARGLAAAARA
jgi:hypothetical protein